MIVSKETLEFPLNSESLRKMEDIEAIIEREFNYGGCLGPRFFMEIITSIVEQICESEKAK